MRLKAGVNLSGALTPGEAASIFAAWHLGLALLRRNGDLLAIADTRSDEANLWALVLEVTTDHWEPVSLEGRCEPRTLSVVTHLLYSKYNLEVIQPTHITDIKDFAQLEAATSRFGIGTLNSGEKQGSSQGGKRISFQTGLNNEPSRHVVSVRKRAGSQSDIQSEGAWTEDEEQPRTWINRPTREASEVLSQERCWRLVRR